MEVAFVYLAEHVDLNPCLCHVFPSILMLLDFACDLVCTKYLLVLG